MSSARGQVVAVALLVGGTWAIGAILPTGGYLGGPATFIDVVSIWWYSLMLSSLASVGWLIVRLAPGARAVRVGGWLLATAAVAAAVGNALEDAAHVAGAEYLYGIGLLGTAIAMLALTLALLWRRRWSLAALVGGSLAGIAVMAGHGPPIVPILWLGVAALVSRQGEPIAD